MPFTYFTLCHGIGALAVVCLAEMANEREREPSRDRWLCVLPRGQLNVNVNVPTRAIAELIKSVGYTSMVDFDTGGEPHAPERLSHWAPVSIECSIRSHGAAAHTPELYFIGPLYLVTESATFDPEPS